MMNQEVGGGALIGTTLRDARETQKLSVEEVSLRLKLSEKQINALESEDFSVIGSAIFVRGFIKSYARFLKIDPQPLLDAHLVVYPPEKSESISYNNHGVDKSVGVNFSKLTALILGALLTLALIVWVAYKVWAYQSNTNKADPSSPALSSEQILTPDTLPAATSPTSEHASSAKIESTVTEISLPKAKETIDLGTKSEIKIHVEKAKEQTLIADSVVSEPAKTPAVTNGVIRVKLLLTGSSWIGVQDKNGKTVFSKLAKAGTEEYVDGVPPLKFHIGNVSATQVIFNGETIDLAPSTNNNIARITVGEH
jgi:cytoskeleton protein RodZ